MSHSRPLAHPLPPGPSAPPPPVQAAPEPAPTPPPDPYPGLRLLGTIVDETGNYALIELRPGSSKLVKEGQSFEGVALAEVSDGQARVEVAGQHRTLKIARRPGQSGSSAGRAD